MIKIFQGGQDWWQLQNLLPLRKTFAFTHPLFQDVAPKDWYGNRPNLCKHSQLFRSKNQTYMITVHCHFHVNIALIGRFSAHKYYVFTTLLKRSLQKVKSVIITIQN